ncbi:hypothetical protein L1887_06629 [Cichorium endivia]|nr:hypothetical protein L1887_06629 [Cichorium endivia]
MFMALGFRTAYKELAEAAHEFDEQKLLGSGGYGQVYRGSLPNGTQIAIKVIQLQPENSTKSFNRECQFLKQLHHNILIRITIACSLPDFRALVLPFMANGSLDNYLYPSSGTMHPDSGTRLRFIRSDHNSNIYSDISERIAYLHHHSPVKVKHCDMKQSNVFLNDDKPVLVSNFGIAKLVMMIGARTKNLGINCPKFVKSK